jgi:hypothetical protein
LAIMLKSELNKEPEKSKDGDWEEVEDDEEE